MRFALVNPDWDFTGSTYFGCQEPHYPLELLFSFDKIRAAGHEPLLVDAQVERLSLQEVKRQVERFEPDFLVIPTAPSYLFWRCPQPELRVPRQWFAALGEKSVRVAIGPHPSATPSASLSCCSVNIPTWEWPKNNPPRTSPVTPFTGTAR